MASCLWLSIARSKSLSSVFFRMREAWRRMQGEVSAIAMQQQQLWGRNLEFNS